MLKSQFIRFIFLILLFDYSRAFSETNVNSIVVFDFVISSEFPSEIKNTLTRNFIEELKQTGNFEITGITKRDKILSNLGNQITITIDEEKRKKAGELLDVKKIFTGTVWKVEGITNISAQIIDAETGKQDVTMRIRCSCTLEKLHEQVKILARRIAGLPDDWSPKREVKESQVKKAEETGNAEFSRKLLRYEDERKSVGGAWALSFFIGFGSGNFYSNNPKAGISFLFLQLIGIGIIGQGNDPLSGIFIFLLARQVDWIYAIYGTVRYNKELREKILKSNLYPYVSLAGKTPVYGFGMRF